MIVVKAICIDASTICQLSCPACPTANGTTIKNLGKGFLRFGDFKKIIDDNPAIYEIEFSNWGEVFLNRELIHMIKYSYQQGVRLNAENGVNLNYVHPDVHEALVRYKFRRITCSIDGASQETYEKYRVGGDLGRVIDNIKQINRYKKKYHSYHPVLKWQFIPFGHNEGDIEKARKMAEVLNMKFRVKLSWDDLYTAAYSPVKDLELVRKESGTGAANRSEYNRIFGKQYVSKCCLALWNRPRINYDGRLLGCSLNYWDDYGNILKDGFAACINGEKMNIARKMVGGFIDEKPGIPCSRCTVYKNMKQTGNWISDDEIEKAINTYDGSRSMVRLKNRLLGLNAVNRYIEKEDKPPAYAMTVKKPLPEAKKTRQKVSGDSLTSAVHNLSIPIIIPYGKTWKPFPLFKGATAGMWDISCHASALAKDNSPHPPHRHKDEEILMILGGSAKIMLPDIGRKIKLEKGDFVFYPSKFIHTIISASNEPVNYLMLRWSSGSNNKDQELGFKIYGADKDNTEKKSKFSRLVFDGRTRYMQKLHCHITDLKAHKGYEPHSDDYDVVIIVLEGVVETLGKRARPFDAIFYSSGEPHGMYNPTDHPARYVVFEFHSKKLNILIRSFKKAKKTWQRFTDAGYWKKQIKRSIKYLMPA